MAEQKGGHKDRIKTWKIIYRRRRQEKLLLQDAMARQKRLEKKKQKELELQYRLTWKEKTMSFFHTIFGLFIGIFERKSMTSARQKQIVIELQPGENIIVSESDGIKLEAFQKEVSSIERTMNEIKQLKGQLREDKLNEIKENINTKKKTLTGISIEYENTKKKYEKKVMKTEEVRELTPLAKKDIVRVLEPVHMEESIKNAEVALIAAESVVLEKEREILKRSKDEEKRQPEVEKVETIRLGVEQEPIEVIEYIKNTTKEIKKRAKDVERLQKEIIAAKDKNTFQTKYSDLKYLREDIYRMQLKYWEMDQKYEFNHFDSQTKAYEQDQFHLLDNDYVFRGMISEIDDTLTKNFEEKKLEKKEEKKEEKKKEVKKLKTEKLSEIEKADQLVQNHIDSQKREVEKLKLQLSQISVPKKRKIFHIGVIGKMVSNVAKMIAGFFSFSFFKNKAVGLLTGAFFINNGVRGLKNAIRPEKNVSYYEMSNIRHMLKEQNDCIYYAHQLLEDSTSQLSEVKTDFIMKFDYIKDTVEYKNVLNQILFMESELETKKKQLAEQQQHLIAEKNKVMLLEKQ